MDDREFKKITEYLRSADVGDIALMEVCGTHTMAIAKAGIRSLLPGNIRLLSGPGCPVCVTVQEEIDAYLELAMRPGVTVCTYGDMVRVPGSRPGDNLARRRALGADVRIVYSPVDAVEIAAAQPSREVVFLGVGFETTAPGTAAAIKTAAQRGLSNFSVYPMLKLVEPSLRSLAADPGFNVQGFIVPGHVAVIIGTEGFGFLADELGIPSVVTGFEPDDIWKGIAALVRQIEAGRAALENEYSRLVRPGGNPLALRMMNDVLEPCDAVWRGLGAIPRSGLAPRAEYAAFDAKKKFAVGQAAAYENAENRSDGCSLTSLCRCGEVIKGQLDPTACPLFGTRCVPEDPVGPCMVSGEGACAAAYKYRI